MFSTLFLIPLYLSNARSPSLIQIRYIQLWQHLIHVSTCFISWFPPLTKEISFPRFHFFIFFIYLMQKYNFLLDKALEKLWKREVIILLHYISFCSGSHSLFSVNPKTWFNIRCKIYLHCFQVYYKYFSNIRGNVLKWSFNSWLSECVGSSIHEHFWNNYRRLSRKFEARLHLGKTWTYAIEQGE